MDKNESKEQSFDNGLFEAYHSLQKFWWERFDERNNFKWKFSIGIWTIIVLYLSLIITEKGIINTNPKWIIPSIVTSILIGIVYMHFKILSEIAKGHYIDRWQSSFFEKGCLELLPRKLPDDVIDQKENALEKSKKVFMWYNINYLVVTIALSLIAAIYTWVNYQKCNSKDKALLTLLPEPYNIPPLKT